MVMLWQLWATITGVTFNMLQPPRGYQSPLTAINNYQPLLGSVARTGAVAKIRVATTAVVTAQANTLTINRSQPCEHPWV